MISIIMPAHNESSIIKKNILPLKNQIDEGLIELIVVCNGCTDKTASIVKDLSEKITVLETDIPSKANALNMGDEKASYFPRFYIDSDLHIGITDIERMIVELKKPGVHAVAPQFYLNQQGSSNLVRIFYSVWKRMPYFDEGRIAGAYALSQEGRSRFEKFPEIIADDSYVRLHFAPSERITLNDCSVTVNVPKNTSSLFKIKTRSHLGTYQLKKTFPDLFRNEQSNPRSSVKRLFNGSFKLNEILVYLLMTTTIKLISKYRLLTGNYAWSRDNTTR